MTSTHKISSSLFIQSGSAAKFLNGINITGSLSSSGHIMANNFDGISFNESSIPLNVGSASSNGHGEWVINVGETARITASGNFDSFCFIENQTLNDDNINNSVWRTIEKGQANGLLKTSFFEKTYNEPGIYEYLIIANNKNLLQTVVKGTTVTVTNPIASS